MGFLVWHYTKGLEHYINGWTSTFSWVNHYFSLPLLLRTLFAPWKRLYIKDDKPGFNFQRFFENLSFNLISRGIGATVRFILFWVGIVLLFLTLLGGIAGFVFWVAIPVFGIPVYLKYKRQPVNFIEKLLTKLGNDKKKALEILLDNDAGKFVLEHCAIELADLVENANLDKLDLKSIKVQSYEGIIKLLVESGIWEKEFLNRKGLTYKDLILTASWWGLKRSRETEISQAYLGRPGLAIELTFGYTPTLNQYSVDLAAPQPFSHRLIGRSEVVSRMERILTSGNSVLLIGQPGVGKRTVVLEFAHRASTGQFGSAMAYKRILELDYNALLSESKDLNQKKTKLAWILDEAAASGNVILMVRDIQRLTNAEVEGCDFTDIFEGHMEKRDLKIIAVSTNTDYERFIAPNMRLRKYLERVEVTPPTKAEAMQILIELAEKWESMRYLTITIPTLRKILQESDRYITEVPFPEKALELLDAVVTYAQQKGVKIITVNEANFVLAEKTGISFSALTKSEQKKLSDIESIIHKRLINQDVAVNLIGKSLRARTVGVVKENRPIGSFLFLGPTGVGKTETAKVLAKVYYGSVDNIIRFDMAEYAGKEGLERLIGSVSTGRPGVLTTAIKNRPASLLLLDEMEKATPEIYNLFLALLDEGFITDAFGKKINCRHIFVIGTSNAGAEYIRQLVGSGVYGEQLQNDVVNHVLEQQIFSPEFFNRFDGVVVYEPLKKEDLVKIAHLMLSDLSENLKSKNIYLTVVDEAAQKLAEDGYDPAFGARPMRRIVNLTLGDLLGKAILKGEIKEGDRIQLLPGEGKEEFRWEKEG